VYPARGDPAGDPAGSTAGKLKVLVVIQPYLPLPLVLVQQPFDHPDYLFEVKYDGWRCLAFSGQAVVRLVSRNGNVFKRFATLDIQAALKSREAVIDGEIVCLDSCGKPQFYELLRNSSNCYLYAFDLLMLDGQDLRELPLIERKQALRRIVPNEASRLLYADHVDGTGVDLFKAACANDIERIVAKQKNWPYRSNGKLSPWHCQLGDET
jgi:bifunctional non-homologous end joining protein LigD